MELYEKIRLAHRDERLSVRALAVSSVCIAVRYVLR